MFSLDGSRPTLDLIPAFLLLTDFYTLVSTMALLTDWEGWRGIYLAGGTEADDWSNRRAMDMSVCAPGA